jgi:hypothetical protein
MTARQRWLGIAGVVFVVLVVASIFAVPNTPHAHASLAKIVSYYHGHKTGLRVSSYLIVLAIFVGVFFFWYLREHLVLASRAVKSLATIGFAGALIFAISGALTAGISWSLADGVDHVSPTAMQALNVLNSDLIPFISAPGIAVFLAATGIAIITNRMLPVWLGWAGVVLAVVALVIGFFGMLGIGLWILVASIVLLRPDRTAAATH